MRAQKKRHNSLAFNEAARTHRAGRGEHTHRLGEIVQELLLAVAAVALQMLK